MQMPFAKVTSVEYETLKSACESLSPPKGNYLEPDSVSNLLLTVLDYQLKNIIVSKAYDHYKEKCWDRIRMLEDLKAFLADFPNDRQGNLRATMELWGYKYCNRIEQLRDLTDCFDSMGVRDQDSLRQ
jgi:hypothetical protein